MIELELLEPSTGHTVGQEDVIKVQLPRTSSAAISATRLAAAPALVCNKDKSFQAYVRVSPKMRDTMRGMSHGFFRYRSAEKTIILLEKVGEQGW